MNHPLDIWIPYFQYVASSAAAILAIAFLAFQVREKLWRGRSLKHPVAVMTLVELAASMFFSLIFLMPNHPWKVAGYIVGTFGYVAIAWHFAAFIKYKREADPFDKRQMVGAIIPLITFSVIMWVPVLEVKAGIAVWFIFSGISEAWISLRPLGSEKT